MAQLGSTPTPFGTGTPLPGFLHPVTYRRLQQGIPMFLRVWLFVCVAAPALAATHQVPAGGDLQAVIDAAQPGDIIELEPGATYTGNFRLRVKNGTDFVVIRTRVTDGLPGPGVRIHKSHASKLAKIRSANQTAALATDRGAHHWRIELVEFQANEDGAGDIIRFGSPDQTDVAQQAYDLVLDRVYIHGDPATGQKRGIALNSGATEIVNSYFEDFKRVGQEAQAICGWNGSGPFLIENNYMEAASQSIMFGGADALIWNLVPSDITVRRNVMTKPLAWRNQRWLTKNGFELKNARRVLVEGNIIENVWLDGQTGYAVLFKVANQGGRMPWTIVEDVTFRFNIIRHAGGGINIQGHDDNEASQQTRRIQISDNLLYDIDKDRWGGHGDFVQAGAAPRDLYIERNTVFHDGMALRLYAGHRPHEIHGLVFRDNLQKHNTYGVKGDGTGTGNPTIGRFLPGAVFERNVLAGGRARDYPAGNFFPTVGEFESQFVDVAGENFELVPGSMFRTAGSNGRPLGVDLLQLERVLNGLGGVRSPEDPTDPGETQPMRTPGRLLVRPPL
jgi:hypothetical protein